MSAHDKLSRHELVEFATYLYGPEWREWLADALGETRLNLALTFASKEPIPAETALRIFRLMEDTLDAKRREQLKIHQRIGERRREIMRGARARIQPTASSRTAA